MDMFLILATALVIGLTALGVWGVDQEKRQWRTIADKARRSDIRPDWVDEFDKELSQ